MASTFTPNIQIEEPARGDDVGTWDTPVNSNSTLLDLCIGGTATIPLNNAPVVLSAAQFRSAQITYNSTLTGNVVITFPTSFTKSYTIQNLCTGSSAFTVQLQTGVGKVIYCPPALPFDVTNDGTDLKFKNLGPPVGGYWDYAGSSVPNWVANSNPNPFLLCDGTTFSSAVNPILTLILGGTTLPDARGRVRAMLNQGTGRLSSAGCGVDGNTLAAGGGDQSLQAHAHNITDPGHAHGYSAILVGGGTSGGAGVVLNQQNLTTNSATTGITVNVAGSGGSANVQPTYVGGLTMIRAG